MDGADNGTESNKALEVNKRTLSIPHMSISDGIILLNAALFFVTALNVVPDLDVNCVKSNLLIANGETYRLLTAVFMHGSILHMVGNNVCLREYGRRVRLHNPLRYFLYLLPLR